MDNFITANIQWLSIDYTLVILTAYIANELKYKLNRLVIKGYNIKIILLSDYIDTIGLNKNIELIKTIQTNDTSNGEEVSYV